MNQFTREAYVDRDIEETLGVLPTFFKEVPDVLVGTEWESFKDLMLSDQTRRRGKPRRKVGLPARTPPRGGPHLLLLLRWESSTVGARIRSCSIEKRGRRFPDARLELS